MTDLTRLTPSQQIFTVPHFTLECGVALRDVPVAYKTWGKLNETRDNVMVICHAFTGSADVEDWWGPMMGKGKAFDWRRWFIFCANVLGSPYGTASPVTINIETGRMYGPEFPPTTIRDDVRLQKVVLDHLNVSSVGVVIGGSMGGMAVLEWPLCSPPNYVRRIIPLATSARHSAWCISWGEAQRQAIYSDPEYKSGWYGEPYRGGVKGRQPVSGLAAARMSALLTYRSRDSFEKRFGRRPQVKVQKGERGMRQVVLVTPPESPTAVGKDEEMAVMAHNDGHRSAGIVNEENGNRNANGSDDNGVPNGNGLTVAVESTNGTSTTAATTATSTATSTGTTTPTTPSKVSRPPIFSAQGYLRYQGDKFTARFDANCYIHITRKMDTHDVTRGRVPFSEDDDETLPPSEALSQVLKTLPPRALVISIASDGLFTPNEQKEIADGIHEAQLVVIPSEDGHDGFLLEFERINGCIVDYLKREFPEYYVKIGGRHKEEEDEPEEGFDVKKTSVFGEAEVDVTRW